MNRLFKSAVSSDLNQISRRERHKLSSQLLNTILKIMIVLLSGYWILRQILDYQLGSAELALLGLILLLVCSFVLLRKRLFIPSAILTILSTFSGLTYIAMTYQGIRDSGVISYFIIIIFTALLLGRLAAITVSVLSIIAVWIMVYLEQNGMLLYQEPDLAFIARDYNFLIFATAALTFFYDVVINRYIREINQSRSQYQVVNQELTEKNKEITKFNAELKQAKEKAEESDRLKTAFLTNLSHEIRTPMNGIIGFSELVLSREITAEQKTEYNSIIASSCKQLLGVVNDIIDISKIESGIIDIYKDPVDLNKLLREVYNLHSLAAKKRGLKFDLFTALEDDESYVLTDGIKVSQICSNLVGNALKFTSSGAIQFGYSVKEDTIEFFVHDTGVGIEQDMLEKVFDRFAQENTDISRRFGGTGLGLSIAKAYIEKLGGRIWVESEVKKGSRFHFTIPYEQIRQRETSQKTPLDSVANDRIRCLIVEDIEVNEVLLKVLLKKYNFELLYARTGEEAMDIFERNDQIRLILMDIKLPGIDGYEVTRRIRNKNKTVPIIAQTAYALTGDSENAMAAGCDDLITKPITQGALDAIIQKYVS